MSTKTLTRGGPGWPASAPDWAESATVHARGLAREFTFARAWEMPGVFRDMEPLVVVRVEQVCTTGPGKRERGCAAPYVVAGPEVLWADYRGPEVAATLRQIADALDPLLDAPAGGA